MTDQDGLPDNTGVSLNDMAVGTVYTPDPHRPAKETSLERIPAPFSLATIIACFLAAGWLIFEALRRA